MAEINIKISQGLSDLKNLQTPVEGNSIDGLLASLKEAKEISNSFLTELVNQQKSGNSARKIQEIVSSDEDGEESSKKQKR